MHPTFKVPDHPGLAIGLVVAVLVLTADLRGAIGFSSFGVLRYYAIANPSAATQDSSHRRWPRGLNAVGLAGRLAPLTTLPVRSVAAGIAVFAIGVVGRAVALRSIPSRTGGNTGSGV